MKGPRIICDFTDELARQLSSERVTSIVQDFVSREACVDAKTAAQLLGVCPDEFRTRHSRRLPIVELGSGAKGNRYQISDILKYRDKLKTQPSK